MYLKMSPTKSRPFLFGPKYVFHNVCGAADISQWTAKEEHAYSCGSAGSFENP